MNYNRIAVYFLFTAFVFSITINTDVCSSEEHLLKIGYQETDGYPLVNGQGSEIGNPPGIGVDIIFQVAKDLNIKLLVERAPNKRVHTDFKRGKYDGSGFYSFKEKRKKEGRFPMHDGELDKSKRVYVLSYYMYALKGSPVSWDGKRMTGVKKPIVGANLGYSVVGDLKDLGVYVKEVKSTRQNLEMLIRGRIQAYAAQDGTIDPVIAKYKRYQNLVKVGPPIKKKEYYFMFSHQYYEKNREMAEKIWNRIETVRESVISRYKNMDYTPVIE